MHKVWHSFIFAIIVFLVLAFVCFVFPEEGLKVEINFKLNYPNFDNLFAEKNQKKDISKILNAADSLDFAPEVWDTVPPPLPVSDTVKILSDSARTALQNSLDKDINKLVEEMNDKAEEDEETLTPLISNIQYTNVSALKSFFDALNGLRKNPKSIRVLHYGDSQIEVDRISDYLRMKLQNQFGGHGTGLLSLTPVAPSMANRVNAPKGWNRYSISVARDKRVKHSNYGVLANFSRFADYKKVSDTSSVLSSNITISTTRFATSNAKSYNKLKLFYGGAHTKTSVEFYDGIVLMAADSLNAGGSFNFQEYDVEQGSYQYTFKFKGKDSPDFYGVSLESDDGVLVDNIALRGSSGTFFSRMNANQLKQFYDYLNVRLIILQFGGNAMPSMENAERVVSYANYVGHQISLLKRIAPQASILFIGPSDMSIKQGTEYLTYPLLETMRDNLKRVVLENGCAFFDIYDCMGGQNSMPAWVEKHLAAPDYTHFSSQGARKIATLIYTSLNKEYQHYTQTKK